MAESWNRFKSQTFEVNKSLAASEKYLLKSEKTETEGADDVTTHLLIMWWVKDLFSVPRCRANKFKTGNRCNVVFQ